MSELDESFIDIVIEERDILEAENEQLKKWRKIGIKGNPQREFFINGDKYLVSFKDSVNLEIYKNGKRVIHKNQIYQILISAISLALERVYGKVFNEETVNEFFDAIETVIRDAAIAGTDIEVITHAWNALHER